MLNKQTTLKAILGGVLLLASAYLLNIDTAVAQDTSAAVHPNVAISAEFPKAVAGVTPNLVSGRANNLKVTLHNSGAHDLIVKMIVGSVAEVKDFNAVTHNLTPFRCDKTLKAHSALILPYTIKITHPSRDVSLTLLAELVDPHSVLHHQFPALIFNSTVHFTQPASSWLDWKLILGSMVMAGAITSIVMTVTAKNIKSDPKKQQERLIKDKNDPKMSAMDRYAVLANMKADDTPLDTRDNADKTPGTNDPKMSAMDRYAVLANMKADDTPLDTRDNADKTPGTNDPKMSAMDRYAVLANMKADDTPLDTRDNADKTPGTNDPKMSAMDRYAVLANMKADDTPLNTNKDNTDKTAGINDPEMSGMDRYAALSEMKAKNGNLLEPKTKSTTTTATTDMLTGGAPFGILSQMKAQEGDHVDEKLDRNTEPESMHHKVPQMTASADRFKVLADMKATRGDDVLNPDKNMAPTRAL
ncbi:hypothetical protein KI688_010709 [Linnemannia hyalina]|uniref:Uncharacterized protein n=1 Tax=Linnemannia hyalina TaxID=64524 RepID=A0A9P8BU95_9FUNG|nr:hypothetical protein KI688_010709 [Linnemannia hyalina]